MERKDTAYHCLPANGKLYLVTILATLEVDEVSSNDDVNDSDEGSSKAIKALLINSRKNCVC